MRKQFLCAVASILLAAPAFAQRPIGTIRGTVRDSTEAVLPGVTVTASNEGGSAGGGSGCGRPTVKAASRSGSATSSHVPRTMRALTGRSTEPLRGRARSASARLGGAMAKPV